MYVLLTDLKNFVWDYLNKISFLSSFKIDEIVSDHKVV